MEISDVFITRTAAWLPLESVGNDDIESVLGMVGGKPSRARRIILKHNGIRQRHYALDRATGLPVVTNAQMTAEAIRALGPVGSVDCLATGTSSPDQIAPNHGVMVHGALGWPQLEVVSLAGICLSGAAAFKYAAMSVATGGARRAVATGSELASPVLHARRFEAEIAHKVDALEVRPEIAFEKDFLRWMLSDGAGAVLMENEPKGERSLRVRWIDLFSNAHRLPACMYWGAAREGDGRLRGWATFTADDWAAQSIFALQQDVRLLNEHVVPLTLVEPLRAVRAKRGLEADDVDWFLPHLSSMYFAPLVERALADAGFAIPRERWFTNLETRGNTGSASPYIMLDELVRSGRVRPGQTLLLWIPESGRFSGGFIFLEADAG